MGDRAPLFANGSRWVRADFHLHTRRDKQFVDDGGEHDFVSRYCAALKQAGIHVGVITNHNKFDRDEFRALRKAARREAIYLLPGVELSVKDGRNGIHTLVVFHGDWVDNAENHDYVNAFLNVAFSGQRGGYDNRDARSNQDLNGTILELDKFAKDYFLVFAHVEENNGLWGGMDGGRIKELGENDQFRLRTAAFQKVRTRDLRENVKDWLGAWYPAEVEGSDPKSVEDIGRGKAQFIKVGAYTFGAVRFALKPEADRLSHEDVKRQPRSWVRTIRFEGGILDGRRLDVSPEMTCLIGIRGSGKSAILECLRYGLELPMPGSPDETDLRYKEELVRFALRSGGKVVMEVEDAEGRVFEISRILNERMDISHNGELLPGVSIPLRNPLFFGQKELVKRGEGSEEELVERLIGSKLDTIRREIASQQQGVLDVLGGLDRLKDLDSLETEYHNKKRDTEFRLKLFREHGVEEQLRRQVQFNADVTHARRTVEAVQDFVRSSEAFLNEHESELAALPRLESSENGDVINDMNALLDRVRQAPGKMHVLLAETHADLQALGESLGELERRREALKEEFAAIERELSQRLQQEDGVSVRPDEFVKLNAELQKANLALSETTRSRARRNALQDELLKELKRLNDLWHQEFRLIEAETKNLNDSQTALQIIPQYKGNQARMLDELKGHLRGSRLREATLETALEGHADFISLYQGLTTACSGMGDSGEVFQRYFNDARASLLTWQVPNTYQIMFHGKNLRDHSLGQRASALILFILSQGDNDLIVIDQPEDDLDNQTIFEDVIKLIHSLKRGVQFIFATHNANFPVLGDAEQVCACTFTAGAGAIHFGSIDEPRIQKAIVSIMEGGQEAFARRKEIYQLWKQ